MHPSSWLHVHSLRRLAGGLARLAGRPDDQPYGLDIVPDDEGVLGIARLKCPGAAVLNRRPPRERSGNIDPDQAIL
jgi:hypothetical protein